MYISNSNLVQMNQLKSFCVFFSVIFIFFGCTVEKRLYQPGFHIEWHSKKSIPHATTASSESVASVSTQNKITDSETAVSSQSSEQDLFISSSSSNKQSMNQLPTHANEDVNLLQGNQPLADTIYITPTVQSEGIASLVMSLAGGAILVSSLFTLVSYLFILGIVLTLIAFIIGCISISKFKSKRYYYTNNIAGNIGTFISGFTILLCFGIIYLIALFF